ncbi:MAG: shikimate kinase [Candidatus Thiodiazotropha sp.]
MKTVLLGNAGAGKTTLASQLIQQEPAARLSLDELAFSEGAERRSLEESIGDALQFINTNQSWIIEGCYSDIVEPLLPYANTLIFLNPGVESCIAHCKGRPWEPSKFASPELQDANLHNLLRWIREYETREDEYGLKRHRALFNSFTGTKVEYQHASEYTAV